MTRQNISVAQLAAELGIQRPNCYRILRSASVDTSLLQRISQILKHNFFLDYAVCQAGINLARGRVEKREYPFNGETMVGQMELGMDIAHMLMEQEQYARAIEVLTPLFKGMKLHFFQLVGAETPFFWHLCFDIGFCYKQLEQYEMAYYYLDLCGHLDSKDYSKEYFDCLAVGEDMRAIKELSEEKKDVLRQIEDLENSEDRGTEENLKKRQELDEYYTFLQTRYAYSLVNFGQLDKAEELYRSLLQNEDYREFVEDELKYIKELKESS